MVRVEIQKAAWARTKRQGSPMRKNFDTRPILNKNIQRLLNTIMIGGAI